MLPRALALAVLLMPTSHGCAGELVGGQTRFKGGGNGDKIMQFSDERGRWEVLDVQGGPCLA